MHRRQLDDIVFYEFESLRSLGVRHGVFTRRGGVSAGVYTSLNLSRSTGDTAEAVRENRRRVLDALELVPEQSLTSWLVHGNHVRVVGRQDLGQDDDHADGMVTRDRGLALTMRFADCVPVAFLDRRRAAIGLAHAGWMGIARGILPAVVTTMANAFGSVPADLVACVGPSIGPDRYEVGEEVATQVQSAVPENVVIWRTGHHKPHLNLWHAAQAQLHAAGVGEIEVARMCTASDTGDWFSHRAEQGKTGRFGVVLALDA